MTRELAAAMVTWLGGFLILALIVVLKRRARRHGGAMRAGVVGALYEWHNQDKQRALDVIVEGKAAESRPVSGGQPAGVGIAEGREICLTAQTAKNCLNGDGRESRAG
jgi:hypothetical protein